PGGRRPAHAADLSRAASLRPALRTFHPQPPHSPGPQIGVTQHAGTPPLRQQRQSAADRPRQGGTATQPPSKPSTPNMRRLVYPQRRADRAGRRTPSESAREAASRAERRISGALPVYAVPDQDVPALDLYPNSPDLLAT